jgi:hypothetical protein
VRNRTRSAKSESISCSYCFVHDCGRSQSELFTDLCDHHGMSAYRQAKSFLATVDEVWHEPREAKPWVPPELPSIVYYIRFGAFVKIGTTTNLKQRVASLKVAQSDYEVLATEPGGKDLERERHKQFSGCRQPRSELFAPIPALQDHIRSLQAA